MVLKMRRYVKKKLLSLVESMEEAQELIKKQIAKARTDEVIWQLLEDCQNSAVEVGTAIEEAQTVLKDAIPCREAQEQLAQNKVVEMLEEYCEMIYRLGQSIKDNTETSFLFKALQKRSRKIYNSILYDIQDKAEVVFLPYKASMWDSMESIWKAALEDDRCEPYVIPIPYYDKREDGTLGKLHYEGGQYPHEVPITDYTIYDIPKRRPDVIYIHNPYDNDNYVTSVHPDFYAEKLRNHTDMLVYVPYFISDGKVSAHFCVCPGTVYSHRVIVRTEEERKTYIKHYKQFEAQERCEGKFGNAEEKFLALGSPKCDKVLNTKREDIVIPPEWEALIRNPDDSRKKVVLYNTTISAALVHNDMEINKLRNVLQTFRNWKEVALLWRPHPLLERTLAFMRPELAAVYKEIVSRFRKEGWGIYDDSADLNRAIAISDAYYGDPSSVAVLYRLTGKPVMIQNSKIM